MGKLSILARTAFFAINLCGCFALLGALATAQATSQGGNNTEQRFYLSQNHAHSAPPILSSAILIDPSANATLQDVQQAEFTTIESRKDLHLAYTHAAAWLKTRIHNDSDLTRSFFLRFDNPSLAETELYVMPMNGDGVAQRTMRSGLDVPLSQRAYVTRLSSFPITFEPRQTLLIYTRVASPASTSLSFNLLDEFEHRNSAYRHSFWLTAYFGMFCALALYNLLLFSGLRDKVFALYAVFAISFGIAGLSFNGLGTLLFWGDGQINSYRVVAVGYTLSAFFGTLFTQQFLHTQVITPGWHRYLNVLALFAAGGVAGAATLPTMTALQLMDVVGLAVCVSLLSCGIYCACKGVAGARIFVLAWCLLLIGASAFALRNLGLLPSNIYTMYGLQFGSALEMLLLSFGLVARFHTLKRQKEIAQSRMLLAMKQNELELEQKVAQRTQELENMASTDMLTGLLNRNGMARYLNTMLQRSRRAEDANHTKSQVTLYMLDLDDFKPVNDIYGHEAGDVVLKEVAKRLQNTARGKDGIARFGGDEFIIISEDSLKDAKLQQANIDAFIERLQDVIRKPIMLPDGNEVSVHASVGHATSLGRADIDQMLRNADIAMYSAKRQKAAS